MRLSNQGRYCQQVQFLQRQFLQEGDLPFTDVLSSKTVSQALTTAEVVWNDRIYTPLVTLWVFLSQVLSQDHSCRGAVARLIAHRVSQGISACSSRTGAYCQARMRLPEKFFATIARAVGRQLEDQAEHQWLWKGRHVYMFDGSTISMPDTPSNQQAYPQPTSQTPGVGFPLARIAAVFSLSCGTILDLGVAAYSGKGQGEVTLLRKLWGLFRPGDVVLGDSLMCNWRNLYELQEQGVHVVTRLNKALRKADFRKGKRLGKNDRLVCWQKPFIRNMERDERRVLPESLTVRQSRFYVLQPGFRSHEVVIITTLLDPEQISVDDLAELYRQRWINELDFCSLKVTLQMDVLRCKTPELVRKEIWTHVLAYNLIRAIIAQAAHRHDRSPRSISFKAAVQTLEAFQPYIATQARTHQQRESLYRQILDSIVLHQIANRPDRSEPRLRKRRFKKYDYMMKPRNEIKLHMLKRVK
jgi:hypothetical protein